MIDMGYIDETSATLTCEACGITETCKALEYGSQYGSDWSEFRSEHFDIRSDGDRAMPSVASARCKACGKEVAAG
jgi:hypothetical protein